MKISDLLQEANVLVGANPVSVDDVKVEEQDDGFFKVSVGPTAGPMIRLMHSIAYTANDKRGFTVKTKSGRPLPHFEKFKANGVLIKPKDKSALDSLIAAQVKKINNQIKKDTKWKEGAADRRKEAAKLSAQDQKKRRAELVAKYGSAANRVKYRQPIEYGDDGYQWTVFIDGREAINGLTQSEARYYAEKEMEALAKKEGLGQFAKKKVDEASRPSALRTNVLKGRLERVESELSAHRLGWVKLDKEKVEKLKLERHSILQELGKHLKEAKEEMKIAQKYVYTGEGEKVVSDVFKDWSKKKPGDHVVIFAGAPGSGKVVYEITRITPSAVYGFEVSNTIRSGDDD